VAVSGAIGCHCCLMSDTKHVVLIHGSWSRGEQWAPARAAFEQRGYTVHTPTLRHHELPLYEGASKIAPLSLRDYTDDLVALVASLDGPPLLVGHPLGGLVVQVVAARTHHAGMVAACPSAVGPAGLNPTTLRLSFRHGRQPRPCARPNAVGINEPVSQRNSSQ
jgi:pimeloyl-ACP methyl ester carboxylesterase